MTMLSPVAEQRTDAGATAAQVSAFMRGFSLEATRPSAADIGELSAAAPAGTQVFLSALPKRSFTEAVDHAAAIRAAGYEPVPHLAARSIESRAMLDEFLAQVTRAASVRRVLVIAPSRGQQWLPDAPETTHTIHTISTVREVCDS